MFGTKVTKFGAGATILRSRDNAPLPIDMIMERAPAVFAEHAHESRSARFAYISTRELLDGMARENFLPFEVRQGGSRIEGKREYTKHMIRFRHHGVTFLDNEAAYEVCLVNAHDGTSSYQLFGGIFKFICCNGLISGDVQKEYKIPHKGDVMGQVIDAAYHVIDDAPNHVRAIEDMRSITLSEREQLAFAEAAATLRWDGENQKAPVQPLQINAPHRREDAQPDVWHTLNRVQENLIRGGIAHWQNRMVRNNAGDVIGQRRTYTHTRPVNAIDGDVKLNRALWVLAERMAELKAA